jgi:hypothetical protein
MEMVMKMAFMPLIFRLIDPEAAKNPALSAGVHLLTLYWWTTGNSHRGLMP